MKTFLSDDDIFEQDLPDSDGYILYIKLLLKEQGFDTRGFMKYPVENPIKVWYDQSSRGYWFEQGEL